MIPRRPSTVAAVVVVLAAIVPYLPTLDDYFVRDDFGVVQLLAQKPATYFPRWFYSSWMDDIWGYTPDEIRPFPAVSYQITALGGASSPVLHHALNILLHAANGLVVFALARVAAALPVRAAAFAGVVFVLLPVHTESVAWITGRVDSMPALFYLASFLAYARWRQSGSSSVRLYAWSIAIFFVALFTKQNTITMVGTLVAYDVLVRRCRVWPLMAFVRPYLPFVVLTVGYLWLRLRLFGEVAREGALSAQGLSDFGWLFNRHLTHLVTGDHEGSRVLMAAVVLVVAGASILAATQGVGDSNQSASGEGESASIGWRLLYFGPVWWLIGIVPVMVAGYASPRHVYLAAVGWAMVLAMLFERAERAQPGAAWRRSVSIGAMVLVLVYLFPLYRSIREWTVTASVSHQAVRDVRAEALRAAEGGLLIVGVPGRSWDWALPFAVRPPFTRTNLYDRVAIVSPRALSCCTAQWFEETRRALRRWSSSAASASAIVMRWDEDTGALSRVTASEVPQLPAVARALLNIERPEDLDRNIRRIIEVFAAK